MGKKELFSKEREKYFNNLGWGVKAIEEMRSQDNLDMISLIRERELEIQLQIEDGKIRTARYNEKYKEINNGRCKPDYLSKIALDRETRYEL